MRWPEGGELVADTSWPSAATYSSRSSEIVNTEGASGKADVGVDSFARNRACAAVTSSARCSAGAKAADPGIQVLNGYSQDFENQAKCKEVALNRIGAGSTGRSTT